ncbi:MAG: hypothetical protein DM484_22965 [Candidatus Methylumidiphilus alinenensis]|uniref:Peptidase C51 domain-containing protein n=1 Tax=Candidatus Methylumidiphilus alinenensis TaxID=2202197 RepID=A0A2W4QSY9_9GAMM|nr:MAG: hypothetical protein DM484_22965 [Candidatus Methylumidiphilus alinenensis]
MKKQCFLFLAFLLLSGISMAGTFVWGNCTWGVASVKGDPVTDKKGKVIDHQLPWGGNAAQWCANAKNIATTDKKESVGAIVVFSGPSSAGHVGIVTKAGTMKSMNDISGLGLWDTRAISGFPNKKNPIAPSCYIHYRESKI